MKKSIEGTLQMHSVITTPSTRRRISQDLLCLPRGVSASQKPSQQKGSLSGRKTVFFVCETSPFALSEVVRFPPLTRVDGRASSSCELLVTSDSGTEAASVTDEPIFGELGAAGKNACIFTFHESNWRVVRLCYESFITTD